METDSQSGDPGDSNIQVFVRIRPPSEDEVSSQCVEVEGGKSVVLMQSNTPKQFSFDYVADINASQESIFNRLGKKVIENCIAGYNGTIFAYGQTGSGKTFTMLGPSEESENFQSEQRGVVPRSFEYLFSLVNRERELHGDDKQFLCKCSFLEIYNEQIFDLLEPTTTALQLRESFKTGVYVAGLSEKVVSDAYEAYLVLSNSWMNRRVGATSMNRESSRSHAVFTLQIESKQKKGSIANIKTSQLQLVDLAGSERQKATGAIGVRLKEAGAINKSLSNLGNVIMSLVTESKEGKKRYIPYRDSKLTFLLRDSLGGNSKTSLIACIHSGHMCIGETLSTLQFAKRAKMIKNKAIKNENAQGNIKELQAEIRILRAQLLAYETQGVPKVMAAGVSDEAAPELKKKFLNAMIIQQKTEAEKQELLDICHALKETCDKKDKALMSNKMILKFRDNTIKQLEAKLKGTDTADERVTDLQQEIEQLRKQMEQNPEASRYKTEVKQLKSSLRSLRIEPSTAERLDQDRQMVQELEATYNALVAEQEGEGKESYVTPQKVDSVSTATVEKLRSQVSDLETELQEFKQKLEDVKQAAEKRERMLTSELESRSNALKEQETYIEASKMKSQMEKTALNEQHLQTVLTITTPKKEKYKLRNRTVVGASDTPDLDGTIPFEDGSEGEEGISGEMAPESFLQEDTDALLQELKKEQEKNGRIEEQLTAVESQLRKLSQEKSTVENQRAQLDELLEMERKKNATIREDAGKLERDLKEIKSNKEAACSENRDLQVMLNSYEKQLKESKQRVNDLEVIKKESAELVETKFTEFEARILKETAEKEKVQEELSCLERLLVEEKEKYEILDSVHIDDHEKLEKKNKELLHEVQDVKSALQKAEEAERVARKEVQEEKELRESLLGRLDQEGKEKDKEVLQLIEETQKMKADCETLMVALAETKEDARLTSAALSQTIEEGNTKLVNVEKNLRQAEEKVSQLFGELQQRLQEVSDLRVELENKSEELDDYKRTCEENRSEMTALTYQLDRLKITSLEKDKQADMVASRHKFEMELIQQDLASTQEELNKREELNQTIEQNLITSQDQVRVLNLKIKSLEESLHFKEKATDELSHSKASKEQELSALMAKLEQFEESRIQRNQEIDNLKEKLQRTESDQELLTTRCDALSSELEGTKNSLESAKQETSSLESKVETLLEENTTARQQGCKLQEALNTLMKDNTSLRLDFDGLKLEAEELAKEKEDLALYNNRLQEVAYSDNEEKTSLKADLQSERSKLKQIQMMFADTTNPDLCGIDHVIKSIRTTKEENQMLQEQNTHLVGHHNSKQRINYHEKVKQENMLLKKDNVILQSKCKYLEEQVALGKPKALNELKENRAPGHKNFASGDFSSMK